MKKIVKVTWKSLSLVFINYKTSNQRKTFESLLKKNSN